MQKRIFLLSIKKYNDLWVLLSSLEDVCRHHQFEDKEDTPADSVLVGEGAIDLPKGLEAYVDAIRSMEQSFLGGGGQIESVIGYALRAGFKLGIEYADEVRTKQLVIR